MRREIKKLEQPNLIVDSLDRPKYASTSINYSCNVNGPDCDLYYDDEHIWRSDWKDASDFEHHRGLYDEYDYHICPSCQETNCMKCFDGVLDPGGRCDNKNCEAHDNCGKCEEPYFQDMHGGAYCINPECDKNDEVKRKEAAALRLATKNYWIQCDGPDCEEDGWDPTYNREPEGWHHRSYDHGESSTDYCRDCWRNRVCHECEEPYTEDEIKQNYIDAEMQVCHNNGCRYDNRCQHCRGEVDEHGNCKDEKWDRTGRYNYSCDHGTFCRHCLQESRNNAERNCSNSECKIYEPIHCEHEGCNKELEDDGNFSDRYEDAHHFCEEHGPLHCSIGAFDSNVTPELFHHAGCGTLLNPISGRCPNCEPNKYDKIDWKLKKKASVINAIMCDRCQKIGGHADSWIFLHDLEGWREAIQDRDIDYCADCWKENDFCHKCGSDQIGKYDQCEDCEGSDEEYEQDYKDSWGLKKAYISEYEEPEYPDYSIYLEHCDYPGCTETRNTENPVIYDPLVSIETPDHDYKHYCKHHYNDSDLCRSCGEITQEDYYHLNRHALGHHSGCELLKYCPVCFDPLGQYGQCTSCDGEDKDIEQDYSDAWGLKKKQ